MITAAIVLMLGLAGQIASFIQDAILLDSQKVNLRQKFETWWKVVAKYDKVKLALTLAEKSSQFLDFLFGPCHFSKRLFKKCALFSTSLLVATFAILSFFSHDFLGFAPWKAYTGSIDSVVKITAGFMQPVNYTPITIVDLAPIASKINVTTNQMLLKQGTNMVLLTLITNGIYIYHKIEPIGHGDFYYGYSRYFNRLEPHYFATNTFGVLYTNTDAYQDMVGEIKSVQKMVKRFNSTSYAFLYTVAFYFVLFITNTFLFILSLAFCRTILREIANSGRVITMLSLVFTNLTFIFVCSSLLILFLTFIAIPFFWVLVPALYAVSQESFFAFIGMMFSSAVALFILLGNSSKTIVFISLLPSIYAVGVAIMSLVFVKWRNAFHFIVKHLFIRCAERGPIFIFIASVTILTAIVSAAVQFIHFLGWL